MLFVSQKNEDLSSQSFQKYPDKKSSRCKAVFYKGS